MGAMGLPAGEISLGTKKVLIQDNRAYLKGTSTLAGRFFLSKFHLFSDLTTQRSISKRTNKQKIALQPWMSVSENLSISQVSESSLLEKRLAKRAKDNHTE